MEAGEGATRREESVTHVSDTKPKPIVSDACGGWGCAPQAAEPPMLLHKDSCAVSRTKHKRDPDTVRPIRNTFLLRKSAK